MENLSKTLVIEKFWTNPKQIVGTITKTTTERLGTNSNITNLDIARTTTEDSMEEPERNSITATYEKILLYETGSGGSIHQLKGSRTGLEGEKVMHLRNIQAGKLR